MSHTSTPSSITIDLKLTFNAIQRRLTCSATCPTWKALSKQIQQRFSLPDDFEFGLSYVDDEGENVVLSSDKELAEFWPVITGYDERDLDALPPLRFAIVRLPASQRSTSSTPTITDDIHHDSAAAENDDNGSDSGNKEPSPPKKDRKATLKEDIIAFIEIVKVTVNDNDKIKKAFDKIVNREHKDNGADESEDIDMAFVINEETAKMDAMTAGIVSALLAPALIGPSHPFPHPPPHFGHPHPHPGRGRGGPPHHHGFPGHFSPGFPAPGAPRGPHPHPPGPHHPRSHGPPHHYGEHAPHFGCGRGGIFGNFGRREGFPYPPPHAQEGPLPWDGHEGQGTFGFGMASHFGPFGRGGPPGFRFGGRGGPYGPHDHHNGPNPQSFEGFGRPGMNGWTPFGGHAPFGRPGLHRQDDELPARFERMDVNQEQRRDDDNTTNTSDTSSDDDSDDGHHRHGPWHHGHHRSRRGMGFGGPRGRGGHLGPGEPFGRRDRPGRDHDSTHHHHGERRRHAR